MRRIIIIGASGHGKVCGEIAELMGYEDVLFLDDDERLTMCGKNPVVGITSDFGKFIDDNTDFFVGIGNAEIRQKMQEELEHAGGKMAILVHPSAIISSSAEIGAGTVVMAGTVVNVETVIGKGCIVNTGSSIDHDCEISDYCHIAVGAHLSGTVEIGNGTWIGTGVIVSNNVKICGCCIIGAGAVVVKDITMAGTYVGIPAKRK